MGTVLTAVVELRQPGESWMMVAVWSLQKDYALMSALAEQATADWPHDVAYRDEPRYDFHRYWLDGNMVVDGVSEPSPQWKALEASLLPLVRAGDCRVLFVER